MIEWYGVGIGSGVGEELDAPRDDVVHGPDDRDPPAPFQVALSRPSGFVGPGPGERRTWSLRLEWATYWIWSRAGTCPEPEQAHLHSEILLKAGRGEEVIFPNPPNSRIVRVPPGVQFTVSIPSWPISGRCLVADIYRATRCMRCGKHHTLFDTSVTRRPPGATYSYTCPTRNEVVEVSSLRAPEVVRVVPGEAVPMEWVSD